MALAFTSTLNLQTAWIGFLLGCISGAVLGLFFHRAEWLGGYGSWRRRMLRLAHISFFGIDSSTWGLALRSGSLAWMRQLLLPPL